MLNLSRTHMKTKDWKPSAFYFHHHNNNETKISTTLLAFILLCRSTNQGRHTHALGVWRISTEQQQWWHQPILNPLMNKSYNAINRKFFSQTSKSLDNNGYIFVCVVFWHFISACLALHTYLLQGSAKGSF